MADMRQYAGGGPEMQQSAASLREYHAQGGHIGAQGAFQSSTGPDRITPTPEEARRAQEAARRAQGSAVQSDMAREAKIGAYAAKQAEEGLHAVMQNVADTRDGTLRAAMFKDRPLVDALCARLAGYCGEGGRNEGVVETLDRLLAEVRAARQGPQPAPPQDGPDSAMLGQALGGGIAQMVRAPGKMFSQETILAILRGRRAEFMAGLRVAPTHDCPAEATVVAGLITIFENLEMP